MAQQAQIEEISGSEPISLQEAKDYLRVDVSDDDTYITDLITIARSQVFRDTNTAIVETDITEYFDNWPKDGIYQLRYSGTLQSSLSVRYYDSSNNLTTLTEDTDYRRVDYMGMPKIEMINTPVLYDRLNSVQISYSVEQYNEEITKPLKIAILMLIQHYYDNRSPVSYLKVDEMPLGYKNIINQYKNYIW